MRVIICLREAHGVSTFTGVASRPSMFAQPVLILVSLPQAGWGIELRTLYMLDTLLTKPQLQPTSQYLNGNVLNLG